MICAMKAGVLTLACIALFAATATSGCIDGITPDCAQSFNTCGPLDASTVFDSGNSDSADSDIGDASTTRDGTSDGAQDAQAGG